MTTFLLMLFHGTRTDLVLVTQERIERSCYTRARPLSLCRGFSAFQNLAPNRLGQQKE